MNILEKIIKDKRLEVESLKRQMPIDNLDEPINEVRDFIAAINMLPLGLIAEVKRKSPSAGIIRHQFNPEEIAKSYSDNGATAISCLIDNKYFGGGVDDFSAVYNAVSLPVLYKEFVVDLWQINHAFSIGAAAVLLIAAVLNDNELISFSDKIKHYGMIPLIEVHNEDEMQRVLKMDVCCVGINNRNLKTFETSLETTLKLIRMVPSDISVISESGIKNANDVRILKDAGVNAILVGEHLLKYNEPGAEIKKMLSKLT